MPSVRTGHFVQIWREPIPPEKGPGFVKAEQWQTQLREVDGYHNSHGYNYHVHVYRSSDREAGWDYATREMSRRAARKIARAYKRAGFPSRVIFRGHREEEFKVTDMFGKVS